MKVIYKYTLAIKDIQKVEMPMKSEILSTKEQNGILCLWALVDKNETVTLDYEIEIFGTGNPIENYMSTVREFIDTVIMPNGLVWHVFKRLI